MSRTVWIVGGVVVGVAVVVVVYFVVRRAAGRALEATIDSAADAVGDAIDGDPPDVVELPDGDGAVERVDNVPGGASVREEPQILPMPYFSGVLP